MILKYGPKDFLISDKEPAGYFYKDNVQKALPRFLDIWREKIQVIYLDPPFFTGKKYYFKQRVGEEGWSKNSEHILTQQAYSDVWESRESFLTMLRQVLTLSHQMLKPDGSMFLHLDYRFSSYARLLMDEIFGEENFLNEIIWAYKSGGRSKRYFSRKHDTILFYRKSNQHYFNLEAIGKSRGSEKRNNMKKQVDEDGKTFWSIRSNGKEYRYYEDSKVYPSDVWDDISHLQQKDPERTGYDTQKPEALLERIILSTSREGDWVGDFFAGSGTTPVVAQKNNRKWIAVDQGDFSIHVCRKRLLQNSIGEILAFSDPGLKPQNLDDNKNINVKITRDNMIKIELLNYHCESAPDLIHCFSDFIDYWSIGYLKNNDFFALQLSYRSYENPDLKTVMTIPADTVEYVDDIACHIVDITGKQSLIILN